MDLSPVRDGGCGVEGGVVAALDADDDVGLEVVLVIEVGDAVDDGLGPRGADDALVQTLVQVDL